MHKIQREKIGGVYMENQYNYYNSGEQPNNPVYQSEPEPPKHEKRAKRKVPKAVVVTGCAILFGVVSSATFLTTNAIVGGILGMNEDRQEEVESTTENKASLTQASHAVTSDVSGVVETVMPSIVSITNMSVQEVQSFFGGISQQEVTSAGTGIIIEQTDDELLIVSNNHVVADSNTLTVTFNDEKSVEANIKGTDPAHDLAVIAVPLENISSETMESISVATLGDSTKLKAGEPAIAIGNALGYGQSVTTGVISATDRVSQSTDASGQPISDTDVKLIQTDAAINPGNSGGALVNANGEVIGINSAKLIGDDVEGIGYAIPISDVSDIITNLMNQETKTKVSEQERGYLGISGVDVDATSAQRYGMPKGVYIGDVSKKGGADQAGITKGSVIVGFNGITIQSMSELQEQLQYYKQGETVTITVMIPGGDGEYTEQDFDVTLGAKGQ